MAIEQALMFQSLMGFAGLGFVLLVAVNFFSARRSKQYRREVSDMYVSAKIKSLAKADGLELIEEYESFKKWVKKQRLINSDLDEVVEAELMEQVSEKKAKK